MGFIDFILSLILLALAVASIWIIGVPLYGAVRGLFGKAQPRKKPARFGKQKKAASRLDKVDALISEQKCLEAIKQMRKAYVLDIPRTSEKVTLLKNHHQNFLSRCLVIAEEMGSRAENIPEVERHFIERNELLVLLLKARESFQSLKSRREQAGKNIPSWSQSDFEQRIKEIQTELERNEKELEKSITTLLDALSVPSSENIVYH